MKIITKQDSRGSLQFLAIHTKYSKSCPRFCVVVGTLGTTQFYVHKTRRNFHSEPARMPPPQNENQVGDDQNENENGDLNEHENRDEAEGENKDQNENPNEVLAAVGDGAAAEAEEANENQNGNGGLTATAVADGAAVVVGGAAGAAVATPWLLVPIGFTQGGVVGGSIAAGIQASIGNVAAGSLFAWCQSAAVVGVGGVAAPVALTAAGAYGAYRYRDSLLPIPGQIASGGLSLASNALSHFRRGDQN